MTPPYHRIRIPIEPVRYSGCVDFSIACWTHKSIGRYTPRAPMRDGGWSDGEIHRRVPIILRGAVPRPEFILKRLRNLPIRERGIVAVLASPNRGHMLAFDGHLIAHSTGNGRLEWLHDSTHLANRRILFLWTLPVPNLTTPGHSHDIP